MQLNIAYCPVSLPEIRLSPSQLNITDKQISKFFYPFHFCLISLLFPISFSRDCTYFKVFFIWDMKVQIFKITFLWNKFKLNNNLRSLKKNCESYPLFSLIQCCLKVLLFIPGQHRLTWLFQAWYNIESGERINSGFWSNMFWHIFMKI